MAERRSLASFASGEFDHPQATITLTDQVNTRLDRLRRTLERHREETRNQNEAARQARPGWGNPPMRRRRVRAAGNYSPTFEGRMYSRSDDQLESDEGRPHAAKRRKLEHGYSNVPRKSFKYGHYGQVEPGRLKLDIQDCDGDVHDERGTVYFGPENILKHDQSVYCTKASKCNIVLRHHDGSAFCLEKLFIIAPSSGFTAPIKDGNVYVSMGLDELHPFMGHVPPSDFAPPSPPIINRATEQPSFLESLRDPYIARAITQRSEHEFSPFDDPPPINRERPQNSGAMSGALPSQDNEYWSSHARALARRSGVWTAPPESSWPALVPSARRAADPQSPSCDPQDTIGAVGTHIAVLSDDEITWPEESTPADVLIDRQRRERTMQFDEEERHAWDPRLSRLRRGLRPTQSATAEKGPETAEEQISRGDSVVQARFHIKNGKNMVAIKFDPPVSGTHILLRLEANGVGRNIDIQTVIAGGYAGPRFFPAIEMA